MVAYDVYQINFADSTKVNASDFDRYLKTSHFPDAGAIIAARDLYKRVATVEADDLEHVYEIGNIGPENKIMRHDRMHSFSVGDLVVDLADKSTWYVDSFGFKRVNLTF